MIISEIAESTLLRKPLADLGNVPEELKHLHAWMGTRFEPRPDGKLNKPPYRVRKGLPAIKADKTNPENWTTFEEANAAQARGDVDAIGLVFTDNDPFTVLDLDHVLDTETGEIDADACRLAATFPTYWEVSLSGRGLHGIFVATKPGTRCRTGNTEIYDGCTGARFMVITGNQFGPVHEIRPCQDELDTLYEELFGNSQTGGPPGGPPRHGCEPHELDQEKLLKKARNSKRGREFRELYDHGDRSGYASPNEADYALINLLIFWCAGDGDEVEELFRSSALYRPPPEKHKGYVGISVRNALASYRGSYYQPRVVREKSTPEQRDILTPYLSLLLDASRWKGQKAAAAYKAYAALIITAVENGIATDAEELRVGADVRSLAERAGANRVTLCRSSLPHLTKDLKLVSWRKGSGNNAGEFILHKPKVPSEATTKKSTHFSGSTYGDSLDALARLIRMRSGASTTGKVTELGQMQTVARLGMVAMFSLVILTTSPRGLNIAELVERTGRRKDHVRSTMRKLVEAGIAEESREDFFTLAPAFWSAYDRELLKSGIVAAERRQRKKHKEERDKHDRELKEGRKVHKKPDQGVIDLAAKRRQKLDREAARRQFVQECPRFLSEDQLQDLMQEEYDRMCERVQERLARREVGRRNGKGAS